MAYGQSRNTNKPQDDSRNAPGYSDIQGVTEVLISVVLSLLSISEHIVSLAES